MQQQLPGLRGPPRGTAAGGAPPPPAGGHGPPLPWRGPATRSGAVPTRASAVRRPGRGATGEAWSTAEVPSTSRSSPRARASCTSSSTVSASAGPEERDRCSSTRPSSPGPARLAPPRGAGHRWTTPRAVPFRWPPARSTMRVAGARAPPRCATGSAPGPPGSRGRLRGSVTVQPARRARWRRAGRTARPRPMPARAMPRTGVPRRAGQAAPPHRALCSPDRPLARAAPGSRPATPGSPRTRRPSSESGRRRGARDLGEGLLGGGQVTHPDRGDPLLVPTSPTSDGSGSARTAGPPSMRWRPDPPARVATTASSSLRPRSASSTASATWASSSRSTCDSIASLARARSRPLWAVSPLTRESADRTSGTIAPVVVRGRSLSPARRAPDDPEQQLAEALVDHDLPGGFVPGLDRERAGRPTPRPGRGRRTTRQRRDAGAPAPEGPRRTTSPAAGPGRTGGTGSNPRGPEQVRRTRCHG